MGFFDKLRKAVSSISNAASEIYQKIETTAVKLSDSYCNMQEFLAVQTMQPAMAGPVASVVVEPRRKSAQLPKPLMPKAIPQSVVYPSSRTDLKNERSILERRSYSLVDLVNDRDVRDEIALGRKLNVSNYQERWDEKSRLIVRRLFICDEFEEGELEKAAQILDNNTFEKSGSSFYKHIFSTNVFSNDDAARKYKQANDGKLPEGNIPVSEYALAQSSSNASMKMKVRTLQFLIDVRRKFEAGKEKGHSSWDFYAYVANIVNNAKILEHGGRKIYLTEYGSLDMGALNELGIKRDLKRESEYARIDRTRLK